MYTILNNLLHYYDAPNILCGGKNDVRNFFYIEWGRIFRFGGHDGQFRIDQYLNSGCRVWTGGVRQVNKAFRSSV
jgi:hypothetical protein